MASYYQVYATPVLNGVASSDSDLVTIALYGSNEPIDPNDDAALIIIDEDNDGLINRFEFRDATIGNGIGLNGGAKCVLFDGVAGGKGPTGTLYSTNCIEEGTDLSDFIKKDLHSNFDPVTFGGDGGGDGCHVPCFAKGTYIETPLGPCPIEELKQGDLIITADNGEQPIRWIGGRSLDAQELEQNPNLRPVRIQQGALGNGLPAKDLLVSPQHRMLVASPIVEKMFGVKEVLIAAKKLVGLEGISIANDVSMVEYFHFLCDKHEIVIANDAPTESLLAAPMALQAVGKQARAEIEAILPEAKDLGFAAQPARPIITQGKQLKEFTARHDKNKANRSLCENWNAANAGNLTFKQRLRLACFDRHRDATAPAM